MPKIAYINKKFRDATLGIIVMADQIIREYQDQGYNLTLRQLYYQFVARDLIDNEQKEYKRLGDIISDARLAGHLDWSAIEDRTRKLHSLSHWDGPSDIIDASANSFRTDRWASQGYRPEVWIEKEALAGVFQRVCDRWDVPLLSCKGYTSQSAMWRGARRLRAHFDGGQTPVILHFGDHDPSGIDMTRDIQDRMDMFDANLHVIRLALNMDQVEKFKPPPNPAKVSDSRFDAYMVQYGNESWELDALDPTVLAELVTTTIKDYIHEGDWDESEKQEEEDREALIAIADNWESVSNYALSLPPKDDDD